MPRSRPSLPIEPTHSPHSDIYSMPYPRRAEPTVQMVIRIPETLHAELHSLLVNPVTGRIKFGTWTRTIEAIIRDYVDSQKLTGYGIGPKP